VGGGRSKGLFNPFAFCLLSGLFFSLSGEVSRQAAAPHLFGKRKEQVIARLNLASDPFRNRTLPWTVAVMVSAIALVALVFTLAGYQRVSAEADASERQVQVMRTQRKDLERQAEEIRQTIPPEQLKTLEAAHALVSRKSFSWSQLFSDLEEFLPTSVRVARINVREVTQVGDQTRANLDLTVVGRTPTDVTGMIEEMNRAGAFSAVPLTENHKSGKGESGYEWMLRVSYVQRARRRGDAQASVEAGASAQSPVRENTSASGGRE
jgi:Tfp pilus assembly protein PilN